MLEDRIYRMDVAEAIDDLAGRTLASLPCEMARLIYLASTRDYSSGRYFHDGLAFRFTAEVAEAALGASHQGAFVQLAFLPLESLVEELSVFFRSTGADPHQVLRVWKKLQPYRVVIPQDCDPLLGEFFFSNVRIALAILANSPVAIPPGSQSASPPL